jgi:hypothetical protein
MNGLYLGYRRWEKDQEKGRWKLRVVLPPRDSLAHLALISFVIEVTKKCTANNVEQIYHKYSMHTYLIQMVVLINVFSKTSCFIILITLDTFSFFRNESRIYFYENSHQ